MKKLILFSVMFVCGLFIAMAQNSGDEKKAEIKFEKLVHDFGNFPESSPKVSCVFKFTNIGTAPLIINQAVASCGCAVADYPKKPIAPGEKGELIVKYNGVGKFPGHFKKSITVRTNGVVEMTRLYIEGNMTEKK